MKKLNEIIGLRSHSRGYASNHMLAYSWYKTALREGKTFTLLFSPDSVESMRYRKGDRCEIWIDEDKNEAMIKLSQTGSHTLSGDGASKSVKISSRAACDYLATVFEIRDSLTPLEVIKFGDDSTVRFKLAPPSTSSPAVKLSEQD